MTTVPPAKSTARPAVERATMVARPGWPSVGQALAVAGDDEECVVDADAEADHDHQSGPKVGHGDEVTECHPGPRSPMPTPTRAVRIGRPMATTDPKARSMTTTAASEADPLARPGRGRDDLSRPARPRPRPADPAGRNCGRCRSPGGRRSRAGRRPWRRTGPPRSRSGGRATAAGWRPGERALHARHVCQGSQGPHQPVDGRGVGGAVERAGERRTTSALSPCWDGNRLARRFWACCEGELPSAKSLSSRLPAQCARPMTATTASIQPSSTRRRWS